MEVRSIFRRPLLKYQLPLYLYIGGIFILSSIPGSSMPGTGISLDKVAHFVEYGILGLLLFRIAFSSGRISVKSSVLLAVLGAAALGALDESYQSLTGRNSDLYDWLFDCLGAVTVVCLWGLYTSLRRARE